MSSFRAYDHLERLGHDLVDGLTVGTVWVFPKLDGTNASVWLEDGQVQAASRRRVLSADADNAGFYAWVHDDRCGTAKALRSVCEAHPNLVFYGEFLVPHTLKTYREDAWRKFYVFDVYDRSADRYLSYDEYASLLESAGVLVIEPLCKITNPSDEQLRAQVETNTYLIADGAGLGEGIVLKNYEWSNPYGRRPWAKVVRNVFKEENRRAFGTTEKGGAFQVEFAIAEEFVTPHLVGKTRAKVVHDIAADTGVDLLEDPNAQRHVEERNRGRIIPQLLSRVFYDVVTEELWAAIKKHKDPTVDFKNLRRHVTARTKALAGDLF